MPKRSDFDKLRTVLKQLNLEQARQLYAELGAIVQALEQQATTPATLEAKGREVMETQRLGDRLYQLERVRCGKVGCKCAGSAGRVTWSLLVRLLAGGWQAKESVCGQTLAASGMKGEGKAIAFSGGIVFLGTKPFS